jgi:glycosyl transferase family 4
LTHFNYISGGYSPYTGYGRYGLYQIKALHERCADVQIVAYDSLDWPGWLQRSAGYDYSRPTLELVSQEYIHPVPGRLVVSTMYETTRYPARGIRKMVAYARQIIVPAEWLVGVMRDSGLPKHIPVSVVPGGVDAAEFPIRLPERSPRKRPYTFLALGDGGGRKGEDIAYRAFFEQFGMSDDVRLIIKCRKGGMKYFYTDDPRVSIWREDTVSMADVFAQVDCFVFPSRGEGWGLPPREAAATGLPVIFTHWSGLTVGGSNWGLPVDDFQLQNSILHDKHATREEIGQWAVASSGAVGERMKWCFDHPDEASAVGQKAAQWLRANQTWQQSADALLKVMETV